MSEKGEAKAFQLPLASMVRALCMGAATSSDVLYEVMLKAALMVDATAQTYGMATFSHRLGERPRLNWVEGLDQEELADAEARVEAALCGAETALEMKAGDPIICLVLSATTPKREGAAVYARCVHAL